MPILRMAPDNTLAETLGGLGSSLAQNLNPKNAAEAQLLLRQIWLRNLELQKQQEEMQARQNAANSFGTLVNNDPNKMAMIRGALFAGQPYENVLKLAIQLSPEKFIDADTPEAARHNIDTLRMAGITWDKPYSPGVGPVTNKAMGEAIAKQAGAVAGQEALGKGSAEQVLHTAHFEDTPWVPGSLQRDAETYAQHFGGAMPDGFLPNTDIYKKKLAANMSVAEAAEKTRQEVATKGIPPTNIIPPGSQANPPPALVPKTEEELKQPIGAQPGQQPQPPAQAPAQGQANIEYAPLVPGTEGWAIPRPMRMQTSSGMVTFEENPSDKATREALQTARREDLFSHYGDLTTNARLAANIQSALRLTDLLDNNGALKSGALAAAQHIFNQYGITLGEGVPVAQALNQLLQTQIVGVLKDLHVTRTANPEIQEAQRIIGQPNWDPRVLKSALATELVNTEQAQQQSKDAGQVLRLIPPDPGQKPPNWDTEYQAGIQKRAADYATTLQKKKDELNAIGASPTLLGQQPPPVSATQPPPVSATQPPPVTATQPQSPVTATQPQPQQPPAVELVPQIVGGNRVVTPVPVPAPVPAPAP